MPKGLLRYLSKTCKTNIWALGTAERGSSPPAIIIGNVKPRSVITDEENVSVESFLLRADRLTRMEAAIKF